jgi:hypothetical protein
VRPCAFASCTEAVDELIADTIDYEDITPPVGARKDNGSAPVEKSDETPSLPDLPVLRDLSPDGARSPILCIAGKGPFEGRVEDNAAVSSSNIVRLSSAGVKVVCLSYLALGSSPAHVRHSIKRIRRQISGATLIVGLWGHAEDEDREHLQSTAADFYASSLKEALSGCIDAASGGLAKPPQRATQRLRPRLHRLIVVTVCMGSSFESWEHPWHSRVGEAQRSIHRRLRHKRRHWGMTSLRCRRHRDLARRRQQDHCPSGSGRDGKCCQVKRLGRERGAPRGRGAYNLVFYSFSMGKRGQWTRRRRGMREGWCGIGTAYRGAVVRQDRIEAPTTWLASVNAGYPGEYSDRGAAMARVQAEVERRMEVPLHDGNCIGRGREATTRHRREGSTGYRPNGNQARGYEFLWRRISLRVRRS